MNYFRLFRQIAAPLFCGIMVFSVASCDDDDDTTPAPQYELPSCGDNLKVLRNDYAEAGKEYPQFDEKSYEEDGETIVEGTFFEARYLLNGFVSEHEAKDLKVVQTVNVYARLDRPREVTDILYQYCNYQTAPRSVFWMDSLHDIFAGDTHIVSSQFDSFITLERAIELVKAAEVADPQTRNVTLRHPVMPMGSPRYVFGGSPFREEHVHVDAVTGQVYVYLGSSPAGEEIPLKGPLAE